MGGRRTQCQIANAGTRAQSIGERQSAVTADLFVKQQGSEWRRRLERVGDRQGTSRTDAVVVELQVDNRAVDP